MFGVAVMHFLWLLFLPAGGVAAVVGVGAVVFVRSFRGGWK